MFLREAIDKKDGLDILASGPGAGVIKAGGPGSGRHPGYGSFKGPEVTRYSHGVGRTYRSGGHAFEVQNNKAGKHMVSEYDPNRSEWKTMHTGDKDSAAKFVADRYGIQASSILAGGPGSGCRGENCGRHGGGKGTDKTHIPKKATVSTNTRADVYAPARSQRSQVQSKLKELGYKKESALAGAERWEHPNGYSATLRHGTGRTSFAKDHLYVQNAPEDHHTQFKKMY